MNEIEVEKFILFLVRKIERRNSEKDKAFDVEQLQNAIQALTNEVIGLKKTNSETSYSRGYFRNQFRQNPKLIIKQVHLLI